jgi:hypothetical protein
MAYFPNGLSGECFANQCARCKYGEAPCPIALVQAVYNYDACNNEVATKILGALVKDNGRCAMFAMDPEGMKLPGLHIAVRGAPLFDPTLGPPAPVDAPSPVAWSEGAA